MISALRQRLAREEGGFTLIELLVVIIIIGILLAIAVPSYLGFRDRANRSAAQANVRAAIPAAETYFSDNGSYAGMTWAALQAIDQGLSRRLVVAGAADADGNVDALTAPGANSYCIYATEGGFTFSYGIGNAAPFVNATVDDVACP
jgi:type IV pilus assembly protein PilA